MIKYASVCSGIECPTVAFDETGGFEAQFFSEIKPFPSALLKHHYPSIPNLGDMSKIYDNEIYKEHKEKSNVDLFIGGTPCQSFSVAGLRKGLDDPRGNLALHFLKIVDELRPRWVVWENVAGVLSSWSDATEGEDGERWQTNDFDTFTSGLQQIGYGVAWRILDAQYFGVPQRRRRVFVVGYIGDWRPAVAVLFERESLSRRLAPCNKKGENTSPSFTVCARNTNSNGLGVSEEITPTLTKGDIHFVAPPTALSLNAGGGKLNASISNYIVDSIPVISTNGVLTYNAPSLMASGKKGVSNQCPLIFYQNKRDEVITKDISISLNAKAGVKQKNYLLISKKIRRLTPLEYERLMGLPDNYTQIPWRNKQGKDCPDSHRYEACGNGIAVPVLKWIAERIKKVENTNGHPKGQPLTER